MPLRTVSNTGGNWNATTAWVGGVVPIAGDTVDFTATSGNLTVNVSTANLVGINFTNYVGTITFNNPINTNGTVNLGTGGYTQDGANGLVINGTTTLTSNNVVWSRTLTTSNVGTGTITLADNCTVTGNITLNSSSTTTINGNTLFVKGSLTLTTAGTVFMIGTTVFEFSGNGTWSSTAGGQLRNNVTINTTGTLTLGTSVVYNTGILTYISGTVDSTTNSSTLGIGLGCTLNTSGMTWNNITINNSTITLTSDLNIGGTLTTTTSGANIVINGLFNVNVSGNLTINGTCSGTSTIILNGTGSQTWSHGSVVYLSNSLTINKTSGTLTIGANVYYNTGTLTYTAGTIDTTTNNSTLNINTSVTLNTSTIVWINVTISPTNTSVITLSSNFNTLGTLTLSSTNSISISFSGVGTLNPSGPLGISTGIGTNGTLTINLLNDISVTNLTIGINGSNYSVVINNNTINISGNLTKSGATNLVGIIRGTTAFILNGTGTWSHNSASPIQNNLTINSPSGTITIGTNVYYNTGILTYTIGTVDTTTNNSTLNISLSTTLNTNGINWFNVTISLSGSISITLSSDINVSNNLNFSKITGSNVTLTFTGIGLINTNNLNISHNASVNISTLTVNFSSNLTVNNLNFSQTGISTTHTFTLNSNNITINNNLTINNTLIIVSGTSNIKLAGNGTWSHSSSSSNILQNNLTIDTTGTIIINNIVSYRTGILTYTNASAVTVTGSTLNIVGSSTLNINGVTWNDVNLSGTQTLSSGLNINGNLTTQSSAVVLNGVFDVNLNGNLTINTGTSGTAKILLNGVINQIWSHSSAVYLSTNLTINKTLGILTISGNVYYSTGILKYDGGTVSTTGSTLNINNTTTLDTNGITWVNTTIIVGGAVISYTLTLSSNFTTTGTVNINGISGNFLTLSFGGVGTFNTSGNLNFSFNSSVNISSFTINFSNNLTVNNLSFSQIGASSSYTFILNSNSINVDGNLSLNTTLMTVSGTSSINLVGTGTWSHASSSVTLINNLTINSPSGLITISGNVYYNTGILTYTGGVVTTTGSTLNISTTTTLNTNGISWNNITLAPASSGTFTLLSNLTCTGNLSTGIVIINGLFNVTVGGNLSINGNTSGTSSIILNGTGNWTHGSTVYLSNNLTINTAGTITVGTLVYYNTGTLTYSGGTVNTTTNNSTLNINSSATLNTGSVVWNTITTSGTTTLTLSSNLNTTNLTVSGTLTFTLGGNVLSVSGNLTVNSNTTFNVPQNLQVTNLSLGGGGITLTMNGLFTVSVSGNLTQNGAALGTTNILLNGTGTWNNVGASALQNNLTINTSGTITVSGNIYYNTGTLTYTSGTVITTGSTLNVSLNTTLNTNTLNWTNVTFAPGTFATITITLTSNLNVLSNLLHVQNTGTIILNGLFNINVSGNLSTGAIVSGTSTHILNGTGTISTGNFFRTSLTISTSGTITISGNFFFSTGTLTYVTGTVVYTSTATLYLNLSSTLNVGNLTWPIVYINGGGTITLSSNLVTNDFTANQGVINWVTGGNLLIVNNDMIVGSDQYPTGGGTTTLTIPNELKVKNLTLNTTAFNSAGGIYPTTVNGSAIYVQGNLKVGNYSYITNPITGTSNIILIGTGTFTMVGSTQASLNNNLTFNGGNIRLSGNIFYNTGTLTYLSGNIITKNTTFTISLATTLINCHKINFDRVVITSGVNITMNEFFSGSPSLKTTITPSSTTNYIITFQDRFEKFSKFVKVSRATVSTPGQLTVTTDKGNQLNNVGVKFAPNQISNGLAKNSPSTNNINPNGLSPTYLVTDPTLS